MANMQAIQSVLMPILLAKIERNARDKQAAGRPKTYGSFGIPGIGQVGFGQAPGGPQPYAMGGGGSSGGPGSGGGPTIFQMLAAKDKANQEADAIQRLATAKDETERSAVIADLAKSRTENQPGRLGRLGEIMGLNTRYSGPLNTVTGYNASVVKEALKPRSVQEKMWETVPPDQRADLSWSALGGNKGVPASTEEKSPYGFDRWSPEEQAAWRYGEAHRYDKKPETPPKLDDIDRMTPEQRNRYLENKSHTGEAKPSLFEKLFGLLATDEEKAQAVRVQTGVAPRPVATRPAKPPTIAEQDDKRLTEEQRVQRAKVQAGITARPGQEKSFAKSDEYAALKAMRDHYQDTAWIEGLAEEEKDRAQLEADRLDDQIAAGLGMQPSPQEQERARYQVTPGWIYGSTLQFNQGTRQHPDWVTANDEQEKQYKVITSGGSKAPAASQPAKKPLTAPATGIDQLSPEILEWLMRQPNRQDALTVLRARGLI
jgi:hypothetical protein